MNLVFDENQEEFRSVVRDFLARHSPEREVRRLMATPEGFDPAVWTLLSTIGVTALTIPEDLGGLGHGFAEVAVILEESGRTLLCAPYFSTVVLATTALLSSADREAQREFLPQIADGSLRATFAFDVAPGTAAASEPTVVARGQAGEWALKGTARYVLDGASAGLLLAAARTDDGPAIFAVDGHAPGFTRRPLPTLDLTRKLADVTFNDVQARRIGHGRAAEEVIRQVTSAATVGLALEQVGGASRVLDMAVEYARSRYQFGRQIGSFQAVKHKCADMLLHVEAARSAAYAAAFALASGDDASAAASLAGACCADAFVACASANIQVHGGIGFTWEHPAHLYLKRAKSAQLMFGDPAYHRERLAEIIGA